MAPKAPQRLTSAEAAAEFLGCTERTIRNLISRGELTGYRIGKTRMLRLDMDEVEALLHPVPTVATA